MELLWFYIAVVLAVSDVLHTTLMWKVLNNFYILLGGLIQQSTHYTWQTWLSHEAMEAGFHFIVVNSFLKSGYWNTRSTSPLYN